MSIYNKIIVSGALAAYAVTATPVFAAAPDGASGPWADSVVSASQALRKDGSAVLPDRSDPTQALGVAESTGAFYDVAIPGTFFSLGFGGSIVLGFDNYIVDGAGADLQIFEITQGPTYPDEKLTVEISQNGTTWVTIANPAVRDASIDFAGALPWAKFVRVTDVSDVTLFEATAEGYDLDAVKALNSAISIDPGCSYTQGFWKNHESAWPVASLTLGSNNYTKAELLTILGTPVKGNGLISLAHQLIAAKLNVANGADATAISSTISAADSLIGSQVVGVASMKTSATSALTGALDSYNNGLTGPGHCE